MEKSESYISHSVRSRPNLENPDKNSSPKNEHRKTDYVTFVDTTVRGNIQKKSAQHKASVVKYVKKSATLLTQQCVQD